MNLSRFFIACAMSILISACASSDSKPELTPLELQSLQTQEFEASKNIAFASVVSVFQDLGYIVHGADLDTGFITAESGTDSKHDWIFTGSKYDTKTKATAFVEQVTDQRTNIRLNFVTGTRESSIWGQTSTKDVPIVDPKVYERAFARIGDAIFVRAGVAEEAPKATVDEKVTETSAEESETPIEEKVEDAEASTEAALDEAASAGNQ